MLKHTFVDGPHRVTGSNESNKKEDHFSNSTLADLQQVPGIEFFGVTFNSKALAVLKIAVNDLKVYLET